MKIILVTALLAGCAHNSVSLTTWSSRTSLIDTKGNVIEGKTLFSYAAHTGIVTFPQTKFGALSGDFTAMLTNYGVSVALSNRRAIKLPDKSLYYASLRNNMGMVNLAHDGKDILRCNFSVDFNTSGHGGAQMVGIGVCQDNAGETWNILFG